MSFGNRIKAAREKKKLSQQQLADLLSVTDGTISNYEKGVAFPRFETIKCICDLLAVDPNYLFWDDLSDSVRSKILEQNNLRKYNSLNPAGQQKADEYIDDLIENPKYRKVPAQTPTYKKEDSYAIAAWGGEETESSDQPPIEETTT